MSMREYYVILDVLSETFVNLDTGDYVEIHEATFFNTPDEATKQLLPPAEMLDDGKNEVVVPVTFVLGRPIKNPQEEARSELD